MPNLTSNGLCAMSGKLNPNECVAYGQSEVYLGGFSDQREIPACKNLEGKAVIEVRWAIVRTKALVCD